MKPTDSYWQRYSESMRKSLDALQVTDAHGTTIDADGAYDALCEWMSHLRGNDGTLHLVGNGASASMASHMAVDWTKNAGVRAVAYNDLAFLTAIGNDLGYEHVFAGPVAWYARSLDVLATISSSGNSPNVLRAIEAGRGKGCRIVTFSGMKPDNASRRLGDLNFFVPALTYGIAECSHQVLLHAWFDRFLNVREWEATERQIPPPLRPGAP
jgi:D-sedoheptulose 7-phosphate isomerase